MLQDIAKFIGKTVVVHFVDGTEPISGYCCAYTPAYDNDPEIPSIDIKAATNWYSLDIPDIDHIEIVE